MSSGRVRGVWDEDLETMETIGYTRIGILSKSLLIWKQMEMVAAVNTPCERLFEQIEMWAGKQLSAASSGLVFGCETKGK